MKKKIFLFFIFLLFSTAVFAYEVDINADNLVYDQNSGKISADGNVILVWKGKKVKADYVEFLVDKKVMNAYGGVKIEEDGNAFFADSINYNFSDESGEIKNTFAASSSIFMRAEAMLRQDKDTYSVNSVKISNCDLDHPHTYFKAKKGKITIGKRVTLYNPIFYIGKIPIFYLPIVTKSLEGGSGFSSKLNYKFEPGYTSDGGVSIKNTLEYRFNNKTSASALFDYYGSRGWGYGGQFDYFSNDAKASVFAYHIEDLSTGTDRWTVRPYYWHRLDDKWSIQSQAEFVSDKSFNNYYNQNDWNRVMNTLESYAAITRQDQNGNLMILARRFDTYDPSKGDFETTSLTLPQVNFTYYPKKIFWGITNSFNLVYNNDYREYSLDNFFYKNSTAFSYSLAKDFKFGRRFTLKPTLGFSEEWYDKNDSGEIDHMFLSKYSASLNSRFRATSWMDWNINYSATARAGRNSLQIDSAANDYGIESNLLSYTNYMYIGNRTTVRNFLSYNLKEDRLFTPQKWSPFVTEIIYTPKYFITTYLRQTQMLEPFKFNSLQLDVRVGELEKIYLNFGAFYQNYDDDPYYSYRTREVDNTLGFGLWFTPKWRLDYNIKTTAKLDFTYIRMNEHEFRLYRDLHCYNLGVTWRIRGVYHEVFFKFDLKTNMPFDRKAVLEEQREDERIFYPWR
ncbi:MAG: hypothetical protein FWD54_02065 [Endomicrobia bacterium]|nr:hypothetical protein [Endomicrobiia bacterium]MCL2799055.1 hypothetical protein [Endomicrobiia bacterium]